LNFNNPDFVPAFRFLYHSQVLATMHVSIDSQVVPTPFELNPTEQDR